MEVTVNYMAVILAAISSMVIGFLWYGVFFKKEYMSLMGVTEQGMAGAKGSANRSYAIQFVASLIMAYVLSHTLTFATTYLGTSGWLAGVSSGFWMWLGFVVPVSLGVVLWENKPWKLWFINASHYLATLVVMGIILATWL